MLPVSEQCSGRSSSHRLLCFPFVLFFVAFVSFHFIMRRRRGSFVSFTKYCNYYCCSLHSLDGVFFNSFACLFLLSVIFIVK